MKKLLAAAILFMLSSRPCFNADTPRAEYPRSQFEREQWTNLNSIWTFDFDSGKSRKDRRLQLAEKFDKNITIPFCSESKLSGVGYTDFTGQMWYQRNITIPSDWNGKKIFLSFGAVDYCVEILVDGKSVQCYFGDPFSFAIDLTRYVIPGKTYNLVVFVQDGLRSGLQTGGKQCDNYYSGGCSYTRIIGTWQTVWMEAVSVNGLRSIFVRSDIDQKQLVIEPGFYNESANAPETVLRDGNKTVAQKSVNCADSSVVVLPVKNMKPWSPESPFLYDLVYQAKDTKGNAVDEVKSHAGMRKVHTVNGCFYLSNQPYPQRPVLDQGFYPEGIQTALSDEVLKNDIVLGKKAGFNGTRFHQKVLEKRYYYRADKLGYITWEESASWILDVNRELAARSFPGERSEAIVRDRNHPSLVTWTPFNETWGSGPDAYVRLIHDVYNIMKAIDPTRPVNDASGDNHAITDIWSVHNYEQDHGKLTEQLKMEEGKKPYCNVRDKDFLAVYEGRPYMVDEFGGIPWVAEKDRKNSRGHGGMPENAEAFYKRLESQIDAFTDSPHVTGFCHIQLTDVEQEKDGIYYYDRTPKLDMKRIEAIFEKVE